MLEIEDTFQFARKGTVTICDTELETPLPVANSKEMRYQINSPMFNDGHLKRQKISVLNKYITLDILRELRTAVGYKKYKEKLAREVKALKTAQKLVNFIFQKQKITVIVNGKERIRRKKLQLTDDDDIIFLKLQVDVGLSVVQLVNSNNISHHSPFSRRINNARDWVNDDCKHEVKLMVVARCNQEKDLEEISKKVKADPDILDCIGLQITYQSHVKVFCFQVMDHLKDLEKWVHAFNFPDVLRDLEFNGTPGPHISVCGINTYNGPDAPPEASQGYLKHLYDIEDKHGDEGLTKEFKKIKVFVNGDYGYKKLSYLLENPDIKISDYYEPHDLIADLDVALSNIASHNFNALFEEAQVIRKLENDLEWADEISNKLYPNRFFKGKMPDILS
jgi:hypothetical protein